MCSHNGLTLYINSPYPPWDNVQLYKICPNTYVWASSQSLILEHLRGDMESIYTRLALYGSKNECTRTNNVFLPISEVCDCMVSINRPSVDGAVLHSLTNSLPHYFFPPNLQDVLITKQYELGTWNFGSMFTSLHVSHLTCNMSGVTYHMSHGTWNMLHVK